VLEALAQYKFKSMNCSIDGATPETYAIYRKKGDFDTVIGHIKKLNAYKAKHKTEFPQLTWQFVAFGHNEHEIERAREMAKELSMKFFLKLSWDDLYMDSFSPVKNKDLIRKETGLEAANREEYREVYGKDYIQTVCSQLWREPQINYDGRLLGCCVNYWGDFGNVFQDGLETGLNNEKIGYARDMLLGKKESKSDIPCTTCKIYLNMKKRGNWLQPNDVKETYTESRTLNYLKHKVLGPKLTNQLFG